MIECEESLLRSAPILLANSRTIVERVASTYALTLDDKQVTILPHGVSDLSLADFSPAPTSEGRRYVLFFGRLEMRKGADLICQNLKSFLAELPDHDLVLVGAHDIPIDAQGQTFEHVLNALTLDSTSRARIRLLGAIDRKALVGWVRAAEIVLLPSRFESFGLVYAEAASLSKPIVALDIEAAREVLGQEAAFLVKEGEMTLTSAIVSLASDPAMRHKLGQNARSVFEANFTVEKMGSAFEKFVRDTIAKSKVLQ